MTDDRRRQGRLILLLLAAVFFGPLVIATWLYYSGAALVPEGRTNTGALLEPIVRLADELPASPLHGAGEGHWVLLYANPGACHADCEYSLYTLRQVRRMLGEDMDRLVRVFLHGDTPPDTLFVAREHAGLVTLQDAGLEALLNSKRPAALNDLGFFLIDPLGNLVMYFEPAIDPAIIVEDIEHLLELSRIG